MVYSNQLGYFRLDFFNCVLASRTEIVYFYLLVFGLKVDKRALCCGIRERYSSTMYLFIHIALVSILDLDFG